MTLLLCFACACAFEAGLLTGFDHPILACVSAFISGLAYAVWCVCGALDYARSRGLIVLTKGNL